MRKNVGIMMAVVGMLGMIALGVMMYRQNPTEGNPNSDRFNPSVLAASELLGASLGWSEEDEGVILTELESGGLMENVGFEEDDLIKRVRLPTGRSTTLDSVVHFANIVMDLANQGGGNLRVFVRTAGETRFHWVTLRVPAA